MASPGARNTSCRKIVHSIPLGVMVTIWLATVSTHKEPLISGVDVLRSFVLDKTG